MCHPVFNVTTNESLTPSLFSRIHASKQKHRSLTLPLSLSLPVFLHIKVTN